MRQPDTGVDLPVGRPGSTILLDRYERERHRLTWRRLRTGCALATGLVPFYVLMDYLLYPRWFAALLVLRTLSVALSLAGIIATRRARTECSAYVVTYGLCFGLALLNAGTPVFWLGYSVPYYVALIVLVFGIALLLPLRPAQAGMVAGGLFALYLVASLLHGRITSWVELACNTSFIGTAVAIVLVSVGASERLRRREFDVRVALETACAEKAALAAALADKSNRLVRLNREMEDLVYVASHDLRAPLINVQGFSRELQIGLQRIRSCNGKSPEHTALFADIDESLQYVLTAVASMDGLINSLLNVSRVATRTNPTERIDLQKLVQKVGDSLHHQLTATGIALEIASLPVVTGDAMQLGRVFSNLIENATKYMGSSPERRIEVGMRHVDGQRRFYVADTGPGIPEEAHELIFRLFRRLPNGSIPGEGIGLAMVRKIIEKHGGQIWVESAPGKGATFWFTLNTGDPVHDGGGET
jgi:signal transduction histidine kinase